MAKSGLIVSYYFPPVGGGGVQRWAKLIKYLKRLDWHFSVISGTPEAAQPTDQSLINDIPAETRIIRLTQRRSGTAQKFFPSRPIRSGYWQRWFSAFLHITDSRHAWNDLVREKVLQEFNDHLYDVLILSAPPYSLAELAAEFGEHLAIPVILDLRDPWTINPYKIHPTGLHRYLDRRREYETVRRVNTIISAYNCTLEDYAERIPGFAEKQIQFLPNGYDEQDFPADDTVNLAGSGKFKIGFSGSFYSHLNKPDFLFAALAELERKDIGTEFHHVGTSVYNLQKLAARYGIEKNVIAWGYQPHHKCLSILNQMDALALILDDRWRNSTNTIGGKFYEYLRLKKPIIGLVPENGEAAGMIRKTDSGIVISGHDTGHMALQLEGLIAGEQKFTWCNIDSYSRQKQAIVLDNFLTGVIERAKSKNN